MYKNTITKFILFLILVLIFPIIAFFLLRYYFPIDPILFSVTALTGYYTLCLSISVKLLTKNINISSILTAILLLIILPTGGYYLFSLLVPLNVIIFAGVGFGAYFGVCMEMAFRIVLPRREENE